MGFGVFPLQNIFFRVPGRPLGKERGLRLRRVIDTGFRVIHFEGVLSRLFIGILFGESARHWGLYFCFVVISRWCRHRCAQRIARIRVQV